MAGQQYVFAEAIIGMKKAVARYDASDEDDSASEIARSAQRKLKRKAPRRQSILENGRSVYKKPKIKHAGYQRHILARNPPLIDEDGDEIEDVDDDESMDGSLAEDNPYGDIRLEELLAPLTSAADLATHPSMSLPYYSTHITELAKNAREALQREEKSLWRAKSIMQKLLGDDTWLPVGTMETEYDREILNGPITTDTTASSGSLEADNSEQQGMRWDDPLKVSDYNAQETSLLKSAQQPVPAARESDGDVQMENGTDAHTTNGADAAQQAEDSNISRQNGRGLQHQPEENTVPRDQESSTKQEAAATEIQSANGETPRPDEQNASAEITGDKMQVDAPDRAVDEVRNGPRSLHSDDAEDTNSQHTSRRMTTRALAHATSQTSSPPHSPRTMSPASPSMPFIHPVFKFPVENLVDRDMGLPANEAEDTRTWLLMYIQKQEEVVRQTRALYMGLMEADRKRKLVLKWAKAEGHVGEMSDGEDWVDKEEWELTEDLIKGKEEEEEEGVVAGKKTRARRREEK